MAARRPNPRMATAQGRGNPPASTGRAPSASTRLPAGVWRTRSSCGAPSWVSASRPHGNRGYRPRWCRCAAQRGDSGPGRPLGVGAGPADSPPPALRAQLRPPGAPDDADTEFGSLHTGAVVLRLESRDTTRHCLHGSYASLVRTIRSTPRPFRAIFLCRGIPPVSLASDGAYCCACARGWRVCGPSPAPAPAAAARCVRRHMTPAKLRELRSLQEFALTICSQVRPARPSARACGTHRRLPSCADAALPGGEHSPQHRCVRCERNAVHPRRACGGGRGGGVPPRSPAAGPLGRGGRFPEGGGIHRSHGPGDGHGAAIPAGLHPAAAGGPRRTAPHHAVQFLNPPLVAPLCRSSSARGAFDDMPRA